MDDMFELLESNIECDLVRGIAKMPMGTKKENEFYEKISNSDESASFEYTWRKVCTEVVTQEKSRNFSETRFKRKIGPTQCFEYIETDILFDGKETYQDSRCNDSSGFNYQVTSFISVHVGLRIMENLEKIYKEITDNESKIKKTIGTPDHLDLEIIYICKVYFPKSLKPVIVTVMEVKSKFYLDHS